MKTRSPTVVRGAPPQREACTFATFDSLEVERLRMELAAQQAISETLRARLEVTQRLLASERAAME